MLKVLIADDEKKVCQLIANLVDWEKLGFEIVGIVNDGLSAYKFMQETPVNVMITDIRMPGCDGMELIQKAKVLYPDIHIVIISGYSHFEYAQNAIRYGVEDYLLKPLRKKDMIATLEKILDKYKEEIRDVQKWEEVQKKLEENERKVKRSLLEDIIKKPEKFGGFFAKDKINEEYHYHFVEGYFQALIVKIIPERRREDMNTRRVLLEKGQEILKEGVETAGDEVVFQIIDEEIYGLVNCVESDFQPIYRKLKRVRLDMNKFRDVFGEIKVYIALGGKKEYMQEVQESFSEAREAMQGRFYFGETLLEKREGMQSDHVDSYISNAFKKRFLNAVEIVDLENIQKDIECLGTMLKNNSKQDGKMIGEIYRGILRLFYFGAHSFNIAIPDQYTELLERLELFGTIDEAMAHLEDYIISSLRHWIEEKKYVEARPIRIAKQYIASHYDEALTLEMVSNEIGFNATYFSSMFKKETGMNFSDYLKKTRVDNAKNILLNTEKTVEDISYAVGYSDIKYFSRLFKKLTGVTPTEFRKLYN